MRERERERERGRDIGRGRSRLPVGSLMWDWIPGPRDHDVNQKGRHSITEPLKCPRIYLDFTSRFFLKKLFIYS